MEKRETRYNNNKEGKKKAQIGLACGGGGSLGGIVLWGGTLVVAGFAAAAAAAFAIKKARKIKDANDKISNPQQKENQATSQGLPFILKNSSPSFHCNPRCASNGSTTEMVATQIDSCELDSANSLILEENTGYTTNYRNENFHIDNQESLFTDDSEEDDIKSCNNHTRFKELSFPVLDHSSYELENGIKNNMAGEFPLKEIIEVVKEEEAMDAMKISMDKASLVDTLEEDVENEEDNDDYNGAGDDEDKFKEVCKEVLPVEESIKVDEEEESTCALKISADKTSAIDLVEGEEEEEGDKETVEEPLLMERIEVCKENKAIEDEGDKETVKESPLIERIHIQEEEEAIYGASKISENFSSLHSVGETGREEQEDDDEEEEEEEEEDEEYIMEKSKENSEETGSTSAGSNADEIWPEEAIEALSKESKNAMQNSVANIAEEFQNVDTEDCRNIDSSETNNLNNCRDDCQTNPTPMLLKKVSEFLMTKANDQPTSITKWRNWICRILMLALTILLLFTHRSVLRYLSS